MEQYNDMLLHHQEHQDTRTQQVRHELKELYNDKRLHLQEHQDTRTQQVRPSTL